MGRVWMVVEVALLAVLTSGAATATELGNACPELSQEQTDELDARLKLLLQARDDTPPSRVEVRCPDQEVRVRVMGERIVDETVDPSAGLIEGVLDAVERALARQSTDLDEGSAPESEPPDLDEAGTPDEAGADTGGAVPVEPPPDEPHDAGGLGVGITSEYAFAPIGTLIGPHLDLAVGKGPYAASLTETLRFSSARGRGLLDFDVMAGFGFGAPYVSTHDFGAHVAVGVEWLSAGFEHTRLTDSSPVAELSVRTAWQLGPFSLWASLDVRARFRTITLGDPIDAKLARFTPLVSLGGMVLADPGER